MGFSHLFYRFDFGDRAPWQGWQKIKAQTCYSSIHRFGFTENTTLSTGENPYTLADGIYRDYCFADKSLTFKTDLPEGDYSVKLYLGGIPAISRVTVRAESRRLFFDNIVLKAGEARELHFTVNLRSTCLKNGDSILLNERETPPYLNWDKALTLEISGTNPSLYGMEIESYTPEFRIFLLGDSTLTDQEYTPYSSWGQMLPSFFKPVLSLLNFAESGASLKSFIEQKRLDKIWEMAGEGDYFFIQFAHNDQKPGPCYSAPFGDYQKILEEMIIRCKKQHITPVLVTSMHRRRFDSKGRIINTLEEYPEVMRILAREKRIPLIDLHKCSKTLFETLGPEGSKKAFLHFPPNSFPNQKEALEDDTHFSEFGAMELAKLVLEEIRTEIPGLVPYLL